MAKRKRQNAAAASEAAPESMPMKKTKASATVPTEKPPVTTTSTATTTATTKMKAKTAKTKTTTDAKTKTTTDAKTKTTTDAKTKTTTDAKTKTTTDAKTKTTTDAKTKTTTDAKTSTKPSSLTGPAAPETLQIIAGSYDRVLHGFTATISTQGSLEFVDTFLFNAHASAIRCVAISPPSAPLPQQTQKVLLASGSTDERIHVYNLSAHPPSRRNQKLSASVAPRAVLENTKNRELGTLLHHDATITALCFPTRSKLLSASEDSSVAVARTRDWSVLSAIRAPKAKAQGRPSGDTAAFGAAPSGVNDMAVHPSMKLMISVSKGERCMRLWNLVTGKKAGVLSFGREMLAELGEGRYATGEARRVVWGGVGGADEFAVGFDKGIVVFGMDSVPRCRVLGGARAKGKIHQFGYLTVDEERGLSVLGVATEDGRIAFFSTREEDVAPAPAAEGPGDEKKEDTREEKAEEKDTRRRKEDEPASLPVAKFVGQVGGRADGVAGRIKDFVLLKSTASPDLVYAVGASSDGRVRVWLLSMEELRGRILAKEPGAGGEAMGQLAGTYETHNRITCLAGFVMIPKPEGVEESEDEDEDFDEEGDEEEADSDEEDDSE